MKNPILILLILTYLLSSCRDYGVVYKSSPKLGEDDVFAYRLYDFYNGRKKIKKIRVKNQALLKSQVRLIRDSIIKLPELSEENGKFGIYKYALIVSGDTLYTNSTFTGWRYKSHSGIYKGFDSDLKDLLVSK